MKQNLPVTQIEKEYSDQVNILSTTDLKGAVTYTNEDFLEISGFTKEELQGKNHNAVRHPDMPPAAFADLWKTIKSGESWMGVVKNRCKNGDHYWVDAYVTPIYKNGKIAEYQSVRRKPDRVLIKRAEEIYPTLMAGKMPSVVARWRLPLPIKIIALFACSLLGGHWVTSWVGGGGIAASLVALLLAGGGVIWLLNPIMATVADARRVADNPLAQYIYTGRMDEAGVLQLAMKKLASETSGLIGRIADASGRLSSDTGNLAAAMEQSSVEVNQQFSETDQVASAMMQMSASIQEVASNAQSTAEIAAQSKLDSEASKNVVTAAMQAITELEQDVSKATGVMEGVESRSQGITSILDTIREIAEQTNLLALNAAIEAARAGEAGRGFAVVADEVRTLANRAQGATEEIQNMIQQMQQQASLAADVMRHGQSKATSSAARSGEVVDALEGVLQAIDKINGMSAQIASAVEEQSCVAEEITRSVTTIRDLSANNLGGINVSNRAATDMATMADGLNELAAQFWRKEKSIA